MNTNKILKGPANTKLRKSHFFKLGQQFVNIHLNLQDQSRCVFPHICGSKAPLGSLVLRDNCQQQSYVCHKVECANHHKIFALLRLWLAIWTRNCQITKPHAFEHFNKLILLTMKSILPVHGHVSAKSVSMCSYFIKLIEKFQGIVIDYDLECNVSVCVLAAIIYQSSLPATCLQI